MLSVSSCTLMSVYNEIMIVHRLNTKFTNTTENLIYIIDTSKNLLDSLLQHQSEQIPELTGSDSWFQFRQGSVRGRSEPQRG